MAEENGEGKRAVVRFRPGAKVGDVYVDIDLSPIVAAIAALDETFTNKLNELNKNVSDIRYMMRNGDGISVGQKRVSAGDELTDGVQLPNVPIPAGKTAVLWALNDNVADVYYGGSQSEASGHEFPVPANQSRSVECTNLNQVWIAATVADDGVSFGVERPPKPE